MFGVYQISKMKIINYFLLLIFIVSCQSDSNRRSRAQALNKFEKTDDYDSFVTSNSDCNKFLKHIVFKVFDGIAIGHVVKTINPKVNNSSDADIVDSRLAIQKECNLSIVKLAQDLYDDGIINHSSRGTSCVSQRTIKLRDFTLKESDTKTLENWNHDNFKDATESFLNSCIDFQRRASRKNSLSNAQGIEFGAMNKWLMLCKLGKKYHARNLDKLFFERYFSPFLVKSNSGNNIGTFTGYFLYSFKASKTKSRRFKHPLYAAPANCKISNNCSITRKEINQGALSHTGLEIAWVEHYIDLFMLQIQGSGVADIDGVPYSVKFAGKNKYPYTSIFNEVKEDPDFEAQKKGNSFKHIISWLRENDKKMFYYSPKNPSYVFFNLEQGQSSAIGAQGIPLIASRSIAVDNNFIPYGMPMWVETSMAIKDKKGKNWIDFDQLVVAQDTGSAITGLIRADIFYGYGAKAELLAKNQKFKGFYFMLLPSFAISDLERQAIG